MKIRLTPFSSYGSRFVAETWNIDGVDMIRLLYQGREISIQDKNLLPVTHLHNFLAEKFEHLFNASSKNLYNVCANKT